MDYIIKNIFKNKMYQEDVFNLYERNKLIYSENPDVEFVQPLTIGEISVPCKFKTKCYIYEGEECAICLDKITKKKDAFLTGCGHAFHRKCLFTSFEMKWKCKPFSALRCPLCRCGLGFPDLLTRYINNNNDLDQLENFWLTKEYWMPKYCGNIQTSHYLGFNKNCDNCLHYRKYGFYT